ncbi:MAG TPA: hypothetical protein ENJ10_14520 [Caldithrix abyssi]|uniref:Uncharacterized protein n=1 Tax=Caldithrix abyssi TaxID=187145 RepID=A0A7V1LPR1_CALAY|nr:hypothetical protein [Caldithrix abyssi]
MKEILEKLKKSFGENYISVKSNAITLKDIAEDYGKIAKLRFEKHQLESARDKKFMLLGTTVYPFLQENNPERLRTHETLPMLIDEIKNYNNQIELIQLAINDIAARERRKPRIEAEESIRRQIERLEEQIEKRLSELKAVKEALDK